MFPLLRNPQAQMGLNLKYEFAHNLNSPAGQRYCRDAPPNGLANVASRPGTRPSQAQPRGTFPSPQHVHRTGPAGCNRFA